MATEITAITRRDPTAMTGYRIIAGITCFSVEDGLGISTKREREREKKSKIYIISNFKADQGDKEILSYSRPQLAEGSYLTVFLIMFTVQL